ncbi:MAG: 3-phosphoshikimate 1-carboxyvinyltransferase [Acidobacteriota bacterium]
MIETVKHTDSVSGIVQLPGDKSISHRYAMLAAIAEGISELEHFASSRDCHSTLGCLRSLGVDIAESGDTVTIRGRGLRGLKEPEQFLDAGNSGTTMRLLSGILAGQPFVSTVAGDASLSKRPMGRIIQPLSRMGAKVESREGGLPPLEIHGGSLTGIQYVLPVTSAQVKSCVLLAGLFADKPTAVQAVVPTRDHTEIALTEFGAEVRIKETWIEVDPDPRLRGRILKIPGDLSGAAFLRTAAALASSSDRQHPGVGLNARRRELVDYLIRAGMNLEIANETMEAGEARGDLLVRHSPRLLQGAMPHIKGDLVAALIDEIPILAVLGSQTAGGLEISDAGELRIKESDRIAAIARNLHAMGVDVEEKPDGLIIPGNQKLQGVDIQAYGDHRIAMAFAVAGLSAEGETRIHDAECADVSFPGFWTALRAVTK